MLKPVITPTTDGKWKLARPFIGKIPKGYVTDGASIPRVLWRILGSPVEADTIGPVTIHDWRYSTKGGPEGLSRKESDAELYANLRSNGVGRLRAKTFWLGVRMFGRKHWGK